MKQPTIIIRVLTEDCIKVKGDYVLYGETKHIDMKYNSKQLANDFITRMSANQNSYDCETRIIVKGELMQHNPIRCELTQALYGNNNVQ